MVQKLEAEVDRDSFNVFPYVTLCTLDIICGKFELKKQTNQQTKHQLFKFKTFQIQSCYLHYNNMHLLCVCIIALKYKPLFAPEDATKMPSQLHFRKPGNDSFTMTRSIHRVNQLTSKCKLVGT